ncbi:hypothetical protein FRC00_012268 [Tulasnella sp. 408]|nr:hypothetical protein FRC00_012268 [Tulasnella sp. 408]
MVQAGTYRIRNAKSGTYLDESDRDKNVIHGWDSRPQNDNQKWILEPADGGFRIKNLEHGRYVSVSGRDNNAPVRATSGDKDVWTFHEKGNNRYAICLQGTEQALDLDKGKDENGTSVSIWRYNDVKWQQWELEQIGGGGGHQPQPGGGQWSTGNQPQQQYQGPIAPGTYRIHNVHAGTALDLAGGKRDDGTPVIGWSVGQGSNQTWTLESGTSGYRIKNGASGTYLGYANLTQGELLVGRAQGPEWTITQADQGYQIHPAQNQNLVLDLAEGKKDDGAKICLWGNGNGNNQKWNIRGLY